MAIESRHIGLDVEKRRAIKDINIFYDQLVAVHCYESYDREPDCVRPPGAAMIFLLLFIFLPKLVRYAMKTDTDTILAVFGKNEQFRKVFWTVFMALAGLVLAQVLNPITAQEILRLITGTG